MTAVATEAIEAITRDGLVKLPDLLQVTPALSRSQLSRALAADLITPAPVRVGNGGRGRPALTFTKEDAIFIAAVAALAIVAGIAFLTALKVAKESGAKVENGALTIPLPGLFKAGA